jgi:hypothetical protein
MTDNTPGEGKSLHQPRNPVWHKRQQILIFQRQTDLVWQVFCDE